MATPDERFWAKVDLRDNNGCWLWMASGHKRGYGQFWLNGKFIGSHRYAYQSLVGPIPDGLQLDHRCRVPACVRPDHLEPVTGKVNTLRGDNPLAKNKRKTECVNGHEFTPENTYLVPARNGRHCRRCQADRSRRHEKKRKAARAQNAVTGP